MMRPIAGRKMMLGTVLMSALTLSLLSPWVANAEPSATRPCKYDLYPKVHSCTSGPRSMAIPEQTTINLVVDDGVGPNTAAKAEALFETRGFAVTTASPDSSRRDIDVLVGIDDDEGADDAYLDGTYDPARSIANDDGYVLEINAADRVVAIEGRDNDAAFYGVTTLDQILSQAGVVLRDTLIEDYADVKFRGFIEGFYGTPWSHENRKDLMVFGGDHKMNSYLYGPKNDPYHAARWREPYPAEKLAELKELVDTGRETNVQFVWAAHVGGKIDLGSDADVRALEDKFDQLYEIGVRQFAIFFDDAATNNDQLVNFITRIDREYIKPKGDVRPIIFCPQYYRKDGGSPATINYLKSISRFPKDVEIMWTGDNVVSPVSQSAIDWVTQYIDRPVYMWWNYPVNDLGRAGYVHMGPSKGLHAGVENVSGFAANPMNQAQASKVSLFSVADYTWNTDDYNADLSWQASFARIIPDDATAARALRIFSAHASAGLNPFDTPESAYLLPELASFKQLLAADGEVDESGATLIRSFDEISSAIDTLEAYDGSNGISGEVGPWLDELKRIAQVSRATVQGILDLDDLTPDDPASIRAAMTLISDQRAGLKAAVSSSPKVIAQKELVPFIEEILSLVEIRLMNALSLPPKMHGFGSTTLDYPKMLDGDLSTAAGSGAFVSRGAYFGVNLGRTTRIDNVLISMDAKNYYKQGVLEASIDNATWFEVAGFDSSSVSARQLDVEAQFLRYRATDEFTDEVTGSPNRGLSVKEFRVNVEDPAEVFTNVAGLQGRALSFEGSTVALRGSGDLTVEPGEYFGFRFNKLKNAHSLRIDDDLRFLSAEFSTDGRAWTAMNWSDPRINAATYIRVVNTSTVAQDIALQELSVALGGSIRPTASAHNVSVYSGKVENIVDGDPVTSFWLRGAGGDRHFVFDLGREIPVYDLWIRSEKDLVSSGRIELSSDGTNWRDPVTFAKAGADNVVKLGGESARYVKLTDGVQSNWLKVLDVAVNSTVDEDTTVLTGDPGGLERLLDLDLFTSVDVGDTAGALTYSNVNTPDATNLILVKDEESEVDLKVKPADGQEWIDAGTLTGGYVNVDLSRFGEISEFKLQWTSGSGLRLNELFVGTLG
ncbi:beta-N-acetylglucosaminidase domain-containing protein [Agromyces sp. S2-1-8]|uniref:beta-N-acetylglucosaminidase domain-containing protein n=1 Tax=Agromyces sp. S2-1-8 TaxID=2897180 RepID=UPI001E5BC718|nr:beta-N-acetylglucosaminidase domain-containing protein [Agromyces sp. S2-1-8]MCD5348051.1 beta-N-acetylglucosaminidase domain-containing protein [Agromyces sp. S2-1-8]